MVRSVVICPDQEMAGRLETALRESGEDMVLGTVHHYASGGELERILNSLAADIIFLSFEDVGWATEVVRFLDGHPEKPQIIAIHRVCDTQVLREMMMTGVREFVAYPFEQEPLRDSLRHVLALIQQKVKSSQAGPQIFSFLPSKAGTGTSTLALNVSAAIARRRDRVLLADLDLHSGMTRFFLKLANQHSIVDVMEHSTRLEPELWKRLVTSIESLDVVHAGRINPSVQVQQTDVRNLLHFIHPMYKAVCFDLSGNLERYSLEAMQHSSRVVLVCTPEIPSLHLAQEKLQVLRSANFQDKVTVVLNRVHKRPIFGKEEVEDLLGCPVVALLPNDYHGVERATRMGTVVQPDSALGKKYVEFMEWLMDSQEEAQPRRKYLEYLPAAANALVRR